MKSAILLHTSGFDARMLITCDVYQVPKSGSQFGCSVYASGATIHDTCGSFPFFTSSRNWSISRSGLRPSASMFVPTFARSASGLPGSAFWYWWK